MDIWGVMALLFAGAFFALLVVALFYWRNVRPRLLAMQPPSALDPESLHSAIQSLNESLVRHSALVARLPAGFEVRTADEADRAALAHSLHEVQAGLEALRNFAGLSEDDREALNAIQIGQLDQATTLAQLASQLETLGGAVAAPAAPPAERDRDVLEALQALQEEQSALVARLAVGVAAGQVPGGAAGGADQAVLEAVRALEAEQAALITQLAANGGIQPPDAGVADAIYRLLQEQAGRLRQLETALGALTIVQEPAALDEAALQEAYSRISALNESNLGISGALFNLERQLDRLEEEVDPTSESPSAQPDKVTEIRRLIRSLKKHYQDTNAVLVQLGWAFSRLSEPEIEPGTDSSRRALDEAHRLTAILDHHNAEMSADVVALEQELEGLNVALEMEAAPPDRELTLLDEIRGLIREQQASLLAWEQQHASNLQALRERFDDFVTARQATARLQDIRGIGAVYAERLQAHGVTTFEQLVALPPEWIREIVQAPRGLRVDVEGWIRQAREYLEEENAPDRNGGNGSDNAEESA